MPSGGRQPAGQRDQLPVAARCIIPSASRGPRRAFISKQVVFPFQTSSHDAHPSNPAAPLHHNEIIRHHD